MLKKLTEWRKLKKLDQKLNSLNEHEAIILDGQLHSPTVQGEDIWWLTEEDKVAFDDYVKRWLLDKLRKKRTQLTENN